MTDERREGRIDQLWDSVERNTWAGANIMRGTPPAVPAVDALPTASSDYRYCLLVLTGDTETEDKLHICLKDDSAGYDWIEVAAGQTA